MITATLTNAGPSAFLVVGAPTNPWVVCGMSIGIDANQPYFTIQAPVTSALIPCHPAFAGLVFAMQGADQAGTGCFDWRLSDLLVTVIQ